MGSVEMGLETNLYAEFLMNVCSVTIYGTLRNNNKTQTTAYVSSDQRTISLAYDGQTTSIVLPLGISVKGSAGFPISTNSSDLSLRWDILKDDAISSGSRPELESDPPWSAACLYPDTVIACKDCQAIVVAAAAQRAWKDLPRGLWAETLDQWYCHRPQVAGVVQQDYSGSQGPQLEAGTAFVDTCHFVLPAQDCQAIKIEGSSLQCSRCTNQLGVIDDQLAGYRLYKWALQMRRGNVDIWKKNKIQYFVCAQMLEIMEDQNVRRFLAFSGRLFEAKHGLLLWVFNPETKYSSSRINQGLPRRAMKVLYEKVNSPAAVAEKLQLAVEDLPLPSNVLKQLEQDLDVSHESLPDPAKKFLPPAAMGNWKVALLDRFDDGKTELSS